MNNKKPVTLEEVCLLSDDLDSVPDLFGIAAKAISLSIVGCAKLVCVSEPQWLADFNNLCDETKQLSLGIPPVNDVHIIYSHENPNHLTALRMRAKNVDPGNFSPLSLIIEEGGKSYYTCGPQTCSAGNSDDKEVLVHNFIKLINLYVAENEKKAINFNLAKAVLKIGQ